MQGSPLAIELQASRQHHPDFQTSLLLRGIENSASALRNEQQPTEPFKPHYIKTSISENKS